MKRKLYRAGLALLLVVCSLSLGVYLFAIGAWIPNKPDGQDYSVFGIDVSHHNGEIDWEKVAQTGGVQFAFIKATEGADFVDPKFRSNLEAAMEQGIRVGAYHSFSTMSPGLDQAENFTKTVPGRWRLLPPVIDVEFRPEQSLMTRAEFLVHFEAMRERLRSAYQQEPVVYTDAKFYRDYLEAVDLPRLWIRDVTGTPSSEFSGWLFWQYSSRGFVPGLEERTDLNVFRGTAEQLKELPFRVESFSSIADTPLDQRHPAR